MHKHSWIEVTCYFILVLGVITDLGSTVIAVHLELAREFNPFLTGIAGSLTHVALDLLVIFAVTGVSRLVLVLGAREGYAWSRGILVMPFTLGVLRLLVASVNYAQIGGK